MQGQITFFRSICIRWTCVMRSTHFRISSMSGAIRSIVSYSTVDTRQSKKAAATAVMLTRSAADACLHCWRQSRSSRRKPKFRRSTIRQRRLSPFGSAISRQAAPIRKRPSMADRSMLYFYGLLKADADDVVHMDSDMLFGGGSQVWLEEAIGR